MSKRRSTNDRRGRPPMDDKCTFLMTLERRLLLRLNKACETAEASRNQYVRDVLKRHLDRLGIPDDSD